MTRADYRGARGSNAGDDFHELWAVRQALGLLDDASGLTGVTLEGLSPEDEAGAPAEAWDGVDCGLYYGATDSGSANRVELAQLKYSSADPDKAWTVARLTATTNKQKDNSVIGRLARAFATLPSATTMASAGRLSVRFISNQPVDATLANALQGVPRSGDSGKWKPTKGSDAAKLLTASGLDSDLFKSFVGVLDLSECGRHSRFDLERRTLETIAGWVEEDARVAVNSMLMLARRMMLPEAKGEVIRRETILLSLDVADPAALFPCPSALKHVDQPVIRTSSTEAAVAVRAVPRLCLHGEGGCGKTTALQEIGDALPDQSEMIVFDCYGAGTYLDSDAYRHRPHEAFVHLSNELSSTLRSPLLISRPGSIDIVRAFKKRIERGAEIVAARSAEALLVVAVDAADNSVTAADLQVPPERSFVRDFVTLGDLPSNVRIVVTTRTGSLPSLSLPSSFQIREIKGFTRTETGHFVHQHWLEAGEPWLDDFHQLSQGNPRVQQYALDTAGDVPASAIVPLQPSGKGLDDIFRDRLAFALKKAGGETTLAPFCAALAALPRPIPLTHLAAVAEIDEARARDLCNDLAPGVRLADSLVSFADEDFERFARNTGHERQGVIAQRVATRLMAERGHDPYAAMHIAAALFAANRRNDIIALVRDEREPAAVRDPVLRREAQLRRLRVAMRVSREAGSPVDAVMTLLIGAEALKTDATIRDTFVKNPDLAVTFARDTSLRMILRDPTQVEHHGPLLFHRMAADGRGGSGISVRAGDRLAGAWLNRRNEEAEKEEQHRSGPKRRWTLKVDDIAAQAEAILRIGGADRALDGLRRWRPRRLSLEVAMRLAEKFVASGDTALVRACAASDRVGSPWDLFLLVPLALSGEEVDVGRIELALRHLMRRGLIRFDKLATGWHDDGFLGAFHEAVLTGCELLLCRGGDRTVAEAALALFLPPGLRRRDQLFPSRVLVIDLGLRAFALTERLAGRAATLEGFWLEPPAPPPEATESEVRVAMARDKEKQEELQGLLGPVMGIYDARARTLLGDLALTDMAAVFSAAIARSKQTDYRARRNPYAGAARRRAATSMVRLLMRRDIDAAALFGWIGQLMRDEEEWLAPNDLAALRGFACFGSTRAPLLEHIIRTARETTAARVAASEKVGDLLTLSRLAQYVSHGEANALFERAVAVADETDYEVLGALSLFAALARRGAAGADAKANRQCAINIAIASADASVRLAGHDGFPWDDVAKALATLDPVVALAAVGRWEDEGTVSRSMTLSEVLHAALSMSHLTPSAVVAMLPLLNDLSVDLVKGVARVAMTGPPASAAHVTEALARDELLRFGAGDRKEVHDLLAELAARDSENGWFAKLRDATDFHQRPRQRRRSVLSGGENTDSPLDVTETEVVDTIDWSGRRFITDAEIAEVLASTADAFRRTRAHVSERTLLARMAAQVAPGDRVEHLNALVTESPRGGLGYNRVDAIAKRVAEWRGSPAVDLWRREALPGVVGEFFLDFAAYPGTSSCILPGILADIDASDGVKQSLMFDGIERNVDVFNATSIYGLVGIITARLAPADAAAVASRLATRLVDRIPAAERDEWILDDLPDTAEAGIGRFLYALMSDADVRVRWRAAHALRRFGTFGCRNVLDEVVAQYERMDELSFRAPAAPFYWLSARLWTMIGLDRIAAESPEVIRQHQERLFGIATDAAFPHVLIRAYAKTAALKLLEGQSGALARVQRRALTTVNVSHRKRKRRPPPGQRTFRTPGTGWGEDERRFHFDPMDTLPYWYSPAVDLFADVTPKAFLDAAEQWIVDNWGVSKDVWSWKNEPRRARFSEHDGFSMDHRHGELPRIERYSTHLEWHAMWCAAGTFLGSHALLVPEDWGESWESWIARCGLSLPPWWLADLRSPKPLCDRFWFAPVDDKKQWLQEITNDSFLRELELTEGATTISVASYHSTRSAAFGLSAHVETAFVSPETGHALVRALQSADEPTAYRVPPAGDDLEIAAGPYTMRGWLNDRDRSTRLEEHDPLRYGVSSVLRGPSAEVIDALRLHGVAGPTEWVRYGTAVPVMRFEEWSDTRGDENQDHFKYDSAVRSSGWRLRIQRDALRELLRKTGNALLAEITITRQTKGYEYIRDDEEAENETRFVRILLLREDGSLEGAEGRVGTWASSGKGARHRRQR